MEQNKQRVVILNKVHLLEEYTENDGKWVTKMVSPAPNGLKSGVYMLNLAKDAQHNKVYEGQIFHKDKQFIYQKTNATIIKYKLNDFEKIPSLGDNIKITLSNSKASVASIPIHQKKLKR